MAAHAGGEDGEDGEASDASLLHAAAARDACAFGVLVRRHRSKLWKVAFRIVLDPYDADDAVQDATLRAWRAAGTFRGRAGVETWLHALVTNTSLDIVMAAQRAAVGDLRPEEVGEELTAAAIEPLELKFYLEDALRKMEPKLRSAFFLVVLRGFSIQEAAALLADEGRIVPNGTVKIWVHRARAKLSAQLAEVEDTG